MKRLFFIVVDERDQERFRIFKQSVNFRNQINTWGTQKSVNSELWKKIHKNDIIFFSEKNSNSSITGVVKKKEINKTLSKKLWPNNVRLKAVDHFLIFNELTESNLGFQKLARYCGLPVNIEIFPDLYQINEKFINEIKQEKLQHTSKIKKPILKAITIPIDYDGAPGKTTEKITRFIRDTQKSILLKKKYENRCQVCNYRIEIGKNKFYSEVHHILPLKDGGSDNFSNMVVLCPTHHAEFDYNVIGLTQDGKTIIDKNGIELGKLFFHEDHVLDVKNIKYHLTGSSKN